MGILETLGDSSCLGLGLRKSEIAIRLLPFDLIIQMEDLESVKTLVALGADISVQDLPDASGLTPLDLALLNASHKCMIPNSSIQMHALNIPQRVATVSGLEAVQKGFLETVEYSQSLTDYAEELPTSTSTEIARELKSVGAPFGSTTSDSSDCAIYIPPQHSKQLASPEPTSSEDSLTSISSDTQSSIKSVLSVRKNEGSSPQQSCATYFKNLEANINKKLQDPNYSPSPDEAMELVAMMQESEQYMRVKGSRILCLDGGGIKGLVQIELLRQLEEMTGKRVIRLFDWIVGTSTGGIIALALVYGKSSDEHVEFCTFSRLSGTHNYFLES